MIEIDPLNYTQQLDEKINGLKTAFAEFDLPPLEVFESQPLHYRMRAEFRVWHEGDIASFAMNKPGEKTTFTLEQFPVASKLINQLMGFLIEEINQSNTLKHRLFSCEFLTTQSGEAVVSLIYHRKIDDEWLEKATQLHQQLGINVIGRSRKQKLVVGDDFVTEQLTVGDKTYKYQQVETGFTQPNAGVNEQMLAWAEQCAANLPNDLLELYCGNGNFTCVLAGQFNKVMATEISKVSVNSANTNFAHNNIDNVCVVRISSEEFTQALNKERPFRRLKQIDLDSYNFSTIFVDPPRAGLDDETLKLCQRFDNIIYVSCNPETLKANLASLSKTHQIKRFAAFDQFPYTHHLETGIWLQK